MTTVTRQDTSIAYLEMVVNKKDKNDKQFTNSNNNIFTDGIILPQFFKKQLLWLQNSTHISFKNGVFSYHLDSPLHNKHIIVQLYMGEVYRPVVLISASNWNPKHLYRSIFRGWGWRDGSPVGVHPLYKPETSECY